MAYFFYVFASLPQSILIPSLISNIDAITIASVIAAVIYSFIPIAISISPAPVHALVTSTGSRYHNHDG